MSITIFDAYNKTKKELQSVTEDYVFEAKQIIKHLTGYTNREILTKYTETLSQVSENKLTAIIRQRQIHYPLQYILEQWDFYGITFKVGPGALIPRADTELLVEKALLKIKDIKVPSVLDLCTGTGCIAIALAKNRTDATVTAVEKYDEAKRYADSNKELCGVQNLRVLSGDVFEGDGKDMKYDIIVSNPPYVTSGEMEHLDTEVTFEPATALFGGEDGLTYYRAIAENYKDSLKPGGVMGFEIGEKQAEAVSKILKNAGFEDVQVYCDIEDRQRVVFGTLNHV